jgi:hypothetical protein
LSAPETAFWSTVRATIKKGTCGVKKKPAVLAPIEQQIHIVRGQKIMLDSDLADLYEVPTKQFNRAVKRNLDRFPEDFAFILTDQEFDALRCQIGTSNKGRGGRRYLPYAFTEHGIAMLSAVLHSERAVQVSVFIVRAFVRLREVITAHKDLAARIEKLESGHAQHASIITLLAQEIRALKILPDPPPRHPIGFRIRKRDQ